MTYLPRKLQWDVCYCSSSHCFRKISFVKFALISLLIKNLWTIERIFKIISLNNVYLFLHTRDLTWALAKLIFSFLQQWQSEKWQNSLFVSHDVRKKWFASALADGCELHFDLFQKLEPVFRVKFEVMVLVRAVPVKQICYSGCRCPPFSGKE